MDRHRRLSAIADLLTAGRPISDDEGVGLSVTDVAGSSDSSAIAIDDIVSFRLIAKGAGHATAAGLDGRHVEFRNESSSTVLDRIRSAPNAF